MNGGEREHKTRAAEPFDVVVGVSFNVMSSDALMSMIEFTSLPPPQLARIRNQARSAPNAKD